MTPETADWIYHEVLTKKYRRGVGAEPIVRKGKVIDGGLGPAAVRTCPCHWGPCGHCQDRGRHDRCTTRVGWDGNPPPGPEGWISCIPVWRTGTPCAWRCSCPCPRPAPSTPGLEQLDLFDLAPAPHA